MDIKNGMRRGVVAVAATVALIGVGATVVSVERAWADGKEAALVELDMPWQAAGWSEREAAAHLLDRLAYGARPGEVDRVVEMGLDVWVARQLNGDLRDPVIDKLAEHAKSLHLSPREMVETYPSPGMIRRLAQRAGVVEGRERGAERSADAGSRDERRELRRWARDQGYRPPMEAVKELMAQKIFRALYSENQLTEVLTDFWFNHFNVSITDNQARIYVWTYERDAIRPHVTGSFRGMLEATAKHPAMLAYLDNAQSVSPDGTGTTMDAAMDAAMAERRNRRGRFGRDRDRAARDRDRGMERRTRRPGRSEGLNENYARELMELHTLGVDGGYDQEDVVEVARAFTGWTTYPPDRSRRDIEQRVSKARRARAGFVFEESFIFRADGHDAEAKKVLGQTLPAGRGIEDGLQVLDILAAHPSTARHIARKFAVRFVSDEPPEPLVERLAAELRRSSGDLGRLVVALVESPEFWAPEARTAKIKSPFEVAVSSLRILGAEIKDPAGVYDWVRRMGQPLYAYQAPTGYPDRATAWVNTGSLLTRMNFGLQVASGQVPGVKLDLAKVAGGREPASLDDALDLYLPLLLPERDLEAAASRLRQVIHDPELAQKIADAAPSDEGSGSMGAGFMGADDWDVMAGPGARRDRRRDRSATALTEPDLSPVAQTVGVILGSPAFQRR